jgi:uncharacterized protein (DUF1697 family)
MTTYVALLRAVNVGGTGMLPMKKLTELCTDLGFANVKTYIQSGNVVFGSKLPKAKACAALERALEKHMGKKVDVVLRDAAEMKTALANNPFPDAPPAKVAVAFCSAPVDEAACRNVVAPAGEKLVAKDQEFYVFYPDGMGQSKLKFPKMDSVATVRNINTVAKLVAMSEEIAASAKPARK